MKQIKAPRSGKTREGRSVKATSSKNGFAKHFPVAGFGASAGGLEAFTTLLQHLDTNLGIAYVLIMHLSPYHKSSLREILQTKTKMKVHTVKDMMKVSPNNVYVIPPNTLMSLVDGHFKLAPRSSAPAIGNFGVDYFFSTLASIYKNNSIGIILSGNATDGTLGLKEIKAEGGITFAQDDTAKFPGMPGNAYDSGYADFRLSPENIAKELAHLVKIPYTVLPPDKIEKNYTKDQDSDNLILNKILLIVKAKAGVDFFLHYKRASIYRRVIRRVALNKCLSLNDYCTMLENNEKEVLDLYNDFLINVTSFFRDPDFYQALGREIFPSIVSQRKTTDPIRIWVAGCSTGEEAYSVAITLKEFLENRDLDISFQIFASDLDSKAIEKARLGVYPLSAFQNVSQRHVKRYFRKIDTHYQIDKSIREACIFSQHNLLKDPPFSRMDLISCQNVLIYLETNPQQKILQSFHYALKPSGFLFLGKSETIGGADELFEPLDKKVRVYSRKTANSRPLDFFDLKTGSAPYSEKPRIETRPSLDIEKDVNKILLRRFVSPGILLNENLNIIQFFGVTSSYLGPVVGKASLNVLKMIREDLMIDLRALLLQARKTGKPVLKEDIMIADKKIQREVTIEVLPRKAEKELFFLVVFKENQLPKPIRSGRGKKSKGTIGQREQTIAKLEEALAQSREVIKTTSEEFQITSEELQSHNEEVLSSNEELQSLNEELETSKEELQSANEELTTINEELQKRNGQLKESQNYAKAIVDTVHSPFLVLTSNLQVKSANKSFYSTFNLTQEKAEGSFVYELGDHAWDIPVFRENLNELLGKKANYLEFELKHFFPGIGELTFIVNTYRLLNEDIGNEFLILLAFTNIDEAIRTNKELKQLNNHLEEFLFGASHDLQEPLRKIQTFLNMISSHGDSDEFIKGYLDKISTTAERMTALLGDMRDYSTALGFGTKNLQLLDLNTTVADIIKDLDVMIQEKNAVLHIAPLPLVEGVPILMHQLFYNIIKNSLRFNKGKPVIDISASEVSPNDYQKHNLRKGRNYICVRIKDNGIGFNNKFADKIFGMFQRLDGSRGQKGSGLGLAICKKIVEDHEGVIFAEGEENKGATVSVILPRPVM
ncbi:MAG: CheR family methyltransferase [Cyclobacteriaceae bacterium]